MNFESLKLGFKEYLRKNIDLSEEKYEIDSDTVSIFMYTDEFKNYLQDELNYDIDDFNKSLEKISKYEIIDGKLVNPEEENTQESEDAEVNSVGISEDDIDEELNIDELIVDVINELLQDETFSETIDVDGDDSINTEEIQSFFETIKTNDENEEDISLEDVLIATKEIKDGSFKFNTNNETVEVEEINEVATANTNNSTANNSTSSRSSGTSVKRSAGSTVSSASKKEKTLDDMTESELTAELESTQTTLDKNKDLLTSVIDGTNSKFKAALEEIDSAYEAYQLKLQEVNGEMAAELDEKVVEINNKEKEIADCELEIVDAQQKVFDAQNAYDSAVSKRQNFENILQALNAIDTSNMDSNEASELASQIAQVEEELAQAKENEEAAKENLDETNENLKELNEKKSGDGGLESQLEDLNTQKEEIEAKISEAYPEIQEYMDTYNDLKEQYDSDRAEAMDTINETISKNQEYIAEINQAITNLENKDDTKEYAFGEFGDEIVEYALSFLGDNESDNSADIFVGSNYDSSTTAWCAAYVEYVLENSGCYDDVADWYKEIDNKWLCANVLSAATKAGATISASDVETGDLVVFNNGTHIGIVTSIDGDTVYTVEGNSSDKVTERSYTIGSTTMTFCDIT